MLYPFSTRVSYAIKVFQDGSLQSLYYAVFYIIFSFQRNKIEININTIP